MNGVRDLDAIFRMFDSVFSDDFFTKNNTLGRDEVVGNFYSISNFPPTDLFVREDSKNWVFEFALAFYNEDEIDVSFNGDYMYLKAEKKEEKKDRKYLHRGVKYSDISNRYYLPIAKFDTSNASATFKNGILTVEIPVKPEHQPRRIAITAN